MPTSINKEEDESLDNFIREFTEKDRKTNCKHCNNLREAHGHLMLEHKDTEKSELEVSKKA